MNRITVAATALAVAVLASEASAQSKSLKDRLLGTWHFVIAEVTAPEEYAGIMRGTIAQFGTYTVDEEKQTFTLKFTASTFPNWEGSLQTRSIDKLTDDEFINTNPQVGAGRGSAYNLYRRAR